MLVPSTCGFTAAMRAPGHAQGERSRCARYFFPTHQPPPRRAGQAARWGRGAQGHRGGPGAGSPPPGNPQRGRRRSLRSLPAPTPGAPPGACAPPPGLISAQALHPPPFSTAPPGHLAAATHPLRGWRAVALRALVLPPPTPPRGVG